MGIRTVLIVEDEPKILEFTESYVRNAGFRVLTARTGTEALTIYEKETVDLVLLDLMLPDISGESICKQIRETSMTPIIMITAKTDEESIISGLSIGADDYIVKPFSPRQVVARILALFRRIETKRCGEEDQAEGLWIDYESYSIYYRMSDLKVTKTEFLILSTLAKRATKVFTREEIADQVFDGQYEGYIRSIDSHIKNIRSKIAKYSNHDFISTVRGIGYRFCMLERECNEDQV